MLNLKIYKGTRPSNGAINLRNALTNGGARALVLRGEGSTWRGTPNTGVINWGTTNTAEILRLTQGLSPVANNPQKVATAINKLHCLKELAQQQVPVVPFFQTAQDAFNYVNDARGRIYVRTVLNGHSGEGICLILREDDPQNNREARRGVQFPIYTIGQDLPRDVMQARLFTIGTIGRRIEWRVHVAFGKVILVQKKVRTQNDGEPADANTLVRNLGTGWVYSVNFDPETHSRAYRQNLEGTAVNAVQALGLDFGAVDLVVDNATGQPRVLEINTAPGLEGETTLKAYTDAFLGWNV